MTAPTNKPENIVISVDSKGNFYWNDEPVDQAEALARLKAQSTSSSKEVSPSPDIVTLEVLGDGTFVWNGERVPDAETLDRYWKAAAAEQPQPEVHLKPNREAKYESIRRALQGAQRNGVTNLGFLGNLGPPGSEP